MASTMALNWASMMAERQQRCVSNPFTYLLFDSPAATHLSSWPYAHTRVLRRLVVEKLIRCYHRKASQDFDIPGKMAALKLRAGWRLTASRKALRSARLKRYVSWVRLSTKVPDESWIAYLGCSEGAELG